MLQQASNSLAKNAIIVPWMVSLAGSLLTRLLGAFGFPGESQIGYRLIWLNTLFLM